MNVQLLERYYKNKQYNKGLEIVLHTIKDLKVKGKFSAVKELMRHLENEYAFYIVIRFLDYGLLYHYSNFLARYAYKKFPSIWTLSWNIEEYIENGQVLEVQKLFEKKMKQGELNQYPLEIKEKIQFSYIQILIELNKFHQAERLLQSCQQEVNVKWGYYYLEKGNRERAKTFFLQACQERDSGYKSYMMLAMIEGMEGRAKQGLQFIEQGEEKFSDVPGLLMEKIRRYRDLREFESMMQCIEKLETVIPDHFYRSYLIHLKADYYYEVGNIEQLQLLLDQPSLKESPYQHMKTQGERKMLHVNPVIQKSNYCVPACLQMLVAYQGDEKHQDEIASHIFSGTGSTMPHTIAYWESIGYECIYMSADLSTIKQCIQHELPILLCVDIELASHVQIITGYDDKIGVVYIQDPNTADTLKITYEDYEKTYYMTSYLGIVGIKGNSMYSLDFLTKEDDVYYRQLYHYSELLDQDAERHLPEMLSFLQKNATHPHTKLYIIKHLHDNQAKALFDQAVSEVEQAGVKNDAVYLHVGDGLLAHGEVEQATFMIEKVKQKQHNGFYHFLKGRICYEQDNYEEGIEQFKIALKQDYEHHLTWSYLSLCYCFNGDMQEALEASMIAYDSDTSDLFIVLNHCKILMDNHLFEEALDVLMQAKEVHGHEAAYVFTIGKVYNALGKMDRAIECLKHAIQLEKSIYYPYLLLADILEFEKDDVKGTEHYLLLGTNNVLEKQEVYCRLGVLYMNCARYEEALAQFGQCMKEYPTYSFAFLKYSEVLLEMGNKAEAKRQILQLEQQFNEDVEFLINAGLTLLYHKNVEEGLRFLERGISLLENNWEEPLDEYGKMISEHALFNRGVDFFTKQIEKQAKLTFVFLTYKAMFLHEMNAPDWRVFFEQALEIKENIFTHFQYGEALFQHEEYEEAKHHFVYCLEHNSQDPRYLIRLAEMANGEGESEQEIAYLKKVFEIDFMELDSEYFFGLLDEKEITQYIEKIASNEQAMNQGSGLNYLAYAYGALGDVDKETKLVMQALQREPEDKGIVRHHIQLAMNNCEWKEAQKLVLQAIETHDFYEPFISQFAEIRYQLGKGLTSYKVIEKMPFTNEEKAMVYTIVADYVQSKLLEHQEEGQPSMRKMLCSSSKFLKVTACTLLYEKAIAANKGFKPAYIGLAHLYEAEGMPEEAAKVLTRLLKQQQSFDVMYNLALFHLQIAEESIREEKHVNRAIAVLEDAVKQYPEEVEGAVLLIRIYLDKDDMEAAHYILEKCVPSNLEKAELYGLKGTLLNRQKRFEESKDVLLQGLLLNDADGEIRLELMKAYVGLQQPKQALDEYSRLLADDEIDNEGKYYATCAYAMIGEYDVAAQLVEEILEKDEEGKYAVLVSEEPFLQNIMEDRQ